MVEVAQCATDSLGVGINDQCPSMPRGPYAFLLSHNASLGSFKLNSLEMTPVNTSYMYTLKSFVVVCTECNVAKRCVLDQKLLAYMYFDSL